MLGRSLLTVANVITAAAPGAADWNHSHIFNKHWPEHARFHGVTALAMATMLSSLNVWSVLSNAGDRTTARFFAAAVPVAYWGRSSWRRRFPAPRSRTHRTRSHARQAFRPVCWVRRQPPRRRG